MEENNSNLNQQLTLIPSSKIDSFLIETQNLGVDHKKIAERQK